MKEINENELKDVTGGIIYGEGVSKQDDSKSIPSPAYGECPEGFVLKKGYCIKEENGGTVTCLFKKKSI